MTDWPALLEQWHEFYTFAGTAAATLMGLMFVVVSLGQRRLATAEEGPQITRGLFTPIVVFFATVIAVAMLMLVPSTPRHALGASLVAVSLAGIVYMVASGAYRVWQRSELGLDDFAWYVVVPYASYAALGAAGVALWAGAAYALPAVAATMFLFLATSIRNAWDLVIYTVHQGDD